MLNKQQLIRTGSGFKLLYQGFLQVPRLVVGHQPQVKYFTDLS